MARSATVPVGQQSEADVLDARAAAWRGRPLLRELYRRYFARMVALLARRADGDYGIVVEVGGGSGNFKEYFPRVIATDVVPTRHVDVAADALRLPFADGTVDNLVMMDVLHHLAYPLAFFAEARRVLRPGGRVVLTEPYISPVSRIIFHVAHPEPVDLPTRLFGAAGQADPAAFTGSGAFASNQATPTLLFYRDAARFAERFGGLRVVQLKRISTFMYPMSGGFSGPCLVPRFLWPVGWGVEKLLAPLAALMAFRLVAAVEKNAIG